MSMNIDQQVDEFKGVKDSGIQYEIPMRMSIEELIWAESDKHFYDALISPNTTVFAEVDTQSTNPFLVVSLERRAGKTFNREAPYFGEATLNIPLSHYSIENPADITVVSIGGDQSSSFRRALEISLSEIQYSVVQSGPIFASLLLEAAHNSFNYKQEKINGKVITLLSRKLVA